MECYEMGYGIAGAIIGIGMVVAGFTIWAMRVGHMESKERAEESRRKYEAGA